jgi:peptidoglycan/LPS O-acetylase OafA/YrhL
MRIPTYKTYRADIDGLRALAVLSVVLFHAGVQALPGGFTGVDIFFVISGYLISGIIIRETENKHFSFASFYAHRIKRILPALILVLMASWLFGAISLLPSEYSQLGKHIKSAALFTSNFTLAKEAGYFDTLSDLKPLLHLWSLAVEEQYYLIWPVLLILADRVRIKAFWVILAVLVMSFSASLQESAARPFVAFFMPQTRFWELSIGGLLAYSHHSGTLKIILEEVRFSSLRNWFSAAGLLLIVASLTLISRESPFPGWRALFPVMGASLVIAAGPSTFINRIVLSHPLAVFIGLISYPFYLWHWPLFSFARILNPGIGQTSLLIVALAALVLSWLTYRYVEIPVRSRRYNHHLKSTPVWLMAALVATGGIGFATYAKSGYLFAKRPAEDFKHNISLSTSKACSRKYNYKGNYCLTSSPNVPLGVVLIGDSHANRLFWGLSERLEKDGVGLLNLSGAGCVPLYDTSTRNAAKTNNCLESMNQAFDIALAHPEIKTVFLAARWAYYSSGQGYILDNTPSKKLFVNNRSGDEAIPELKRGLEYTLSKLNSAGKKVVIIHSIPELGFDPAECVVANDFFTIRHQRRPCGIPRVDFVKRQSSYKAWVDDVLRLHPEVTEFDPAEILCKNGFCYAMRDAHVFYSDSHHLNTTGSRYLMQHFPGPLSPDGKTS